jgi:hypothetical protein
MKNEILHFDETKFNQEVSATEGIIKAAQQILDKHKAYGDLFPLVSASQITGLLSSGRGARAAYRSLVVDNLEVPEIKPGIRMKKDAYIQSLELPSFDYISGICEANSHLLANVNPRLLDIDNGVVTINESAVAKLKETYTMYADTKLKQSLLQAHREAAAALDKLNSLLRMAGVKGFERDTEINYGFAVIDGQIMADTEVYRARWSVKSEDQAGASL